MTNLRKLGPSSEARGVLAPPDTAMVVGPDVVYPGTAGGH